MGPKLNFKNGTETEFQKWERNRNSKMGPKLNFKNGTETEIQKWDRK